MNIFRVFNKLIIEIENLSIRNIDEVLKVTRELFLKFNSCSNSLNFFQIDLFIENSAYMMENKEFFQRLNKVVEDISKTLNLTIDKCLLRFNELSEVYKLRKFEGLENYLNFEEKEILITNNLIIYNFVQILDYKFYTACNLLKNVLNSLNYLNSRQSKKPYNKYIKIKVLNDLTKLKQLFEIERSYKNEIS